MNVTLTSLEALILKATHESLACPDAAAMEAFCVVMRDASDGPQLAAQALAARMHAPRSREALLALCMLDRCMRRCDTTFHAEIGKFRFLNEMIKLVSPKYYADRTAPEVRTRVIQLLHAWSIEHPKESKFKVAYDMLKNQGVVKETPPPLPPEDTTPPRLRAKSAIFEDEEKSKLLQKLLQSKKPEDLQHANRLIKTMVREEERRNCAEEARASEVCSALERAGLLASLLAHAAQASRDEAQLIHELHASCAQLRPTLQTLAASDANTENLSDILHASDVLDDVFEKYNAFVIEEREREKLKSDPAETPVVNHKSLLDFAGVNTGKGDGSQASKGAPKNNAIDELGDIFATDTGTTNIAEPLKPVSLMPTEDVDLLGEKPNETEGWKELNSLGETLLKQSLPDSARRLDGFNSKHLKKIPMNALEKPSPKRDPSPLSRCAILDLDFFTQKEQAKLTPAAAPQSVTPNDDVMVDISDVTQPPTSLIESSVDNILDLGLDNAKCEDAPVANSEMRLIETDKKEGLDGKFEVKSLSDINMTLQSVQPSKVPPLTVFEDEEGVTVVLHLCRDRPRPDVYVLVVSTTSRCPAPIHDFKFQPVVPKGCKARLLPASGTSLPAYQPFLPPPALTQLLLLARPPRTPVGLRFVLSYSCREDCTTDMGEVKLLPLDDI